MADVIKNNAAEAAPQQIAFSIEENNTVYDVRADFTLEGKESLLTQLKKLILESA